MAYRLWGDKPCNSRKLPFYINLYETRFCPVQITDFWKGREPLWLSHSKAAMFCGSPEYLIFLRYEVLSPQRRYVCRQMLATILPYSDKREQVTNHPSLRKMFLDWTSNILLPIRVWSRNTHPAERYLSQDIMIIHWCQCKCTWHTHFAHLWEITFSRVASFCQSTAVLLMDIMSNPHAT